MRIRNKVLFVLIGIFFIFLLCNHHTKAAYTSTNIEGINETKYPGYKQAIQKLQNTYYFDRFIEGIDTSKQYIIEITSSDYRNVSPYRNVKVYFLNNNLGYYHSSLVILKDNQIKF